jgi:hypothetical protein
VARATPQSLTWNERALLAETQVDHLRTLECGVGRHGGTEREGAGEDEGAGTAGPGQGADRAEGDGGEQGLERPSPSRAPRPLTGWLRSAGG